MSTTVRSTLTPIALSDYIKKYGDDTAAGLWVINRLTPRGQYLFSCMGEMNRPTTIAIPCTFIPVDLVSQGPKKSILESPSFRRALERGAIEIVDNKEVAELFATHKRSQAEQSRLNRMSANVSGAQRSTYDLDVESGAAQSNDVAAQTLVSQIIELSLGGEGAADLIDVVLANYDALTPSDLQSIIDGVSDSDFKQRLIEFKENF